MPHSKLLVALAGALLSATLLAACGSGVPQAPPTRAATSTLVPPRAGAAAFCPPAGTIQVSPRDRAQRKPTFA